MVLIFYVSVSIHGLHLHMCDVLFVLIESLCVCTEGGRALVKMVGLFWDQPGGEVCLDLYSGITTGTVEPTGVSSSGRVPDRNK